MPRNGFTHAANDQSNANFEAPYKPQRGSNNGLAIVSFILGILSIVTSAMGLGFFFAIIAVSLGKKGRDSQYSALASWGLWLGWLVIVGTILVILGWILFYGIMTLGNR